MRRGPGMIWIKGKWYDKDQLRATMETREVNAPYVRVDEMEALEHPATGQIMTSKSAFRRATKAAGCEEVGNDLLSKYQRPAYEPNAAYLTDLTIRAYDELERKSR